MQKGRQRGAVSVQRNPRATGGGTVLFPEGVTVESVDFEPSSASRPTPFHGSGSVRVAVDGSEANVCRHRKQGGDPIEGSSRPHGPVRRPNEGEAPRIEQHCSARRQHAGDSRHMTGNEGRDNRNFPQILVGMSSPPIPGMPNRS